MHRKSAVVEQSQATSGEGGASQIGNHVSYNLNSFKGVV